MSTWWFSGQLLLLVTMYRSTQCCCHLWYWIFPHTKPGKKYWVFSINVSSVFINFVLIITLSECLTEGRHSYMMKFIFTIVIGVTPSLQQEHYLFTSRPNIWSKEVFESIAKPALYPHEYYKVKKLNEKQWKLNCKKIDLRSQIRWRCVLAALKVVKN